MTSDPSEACTQTIREALKERDPDVQVVLDGILVGMLRAAARLAEADLMWGDDDE